MPFTNQIHNKTIEERSQLDKELDESRHEVASLKSELESKNKKLEEMVELQKKLEELLSEKKDLVKKIEELKSRLFSLTTMAATTPTLDTLPDDVLFNIVEFTGAHSCYRGCGAVCKRINQLFKTHPYSNKLSKSTSYGGYAPFQEIVQKCKAGLEKGIRYESWNFPEIIHQLASGVVTFNRTDLLFWTIETQNKDVFRAVCVRAIIDRKLFIMEKVWESIQDESLMAYMKEQTSFIRVAAGKGNLDILKDLREKFECEWNEDACSEAAGNGHLDCLVYLHKNNCPWNESACSWAAHSGHLDCLVYLYENGCPWDESACSWAAENGHLDCLVYLHKNGCPWDWEACSEAAGNGRLDCLVYLYENDCPWDESACSWAAHSGHLDCLVYLHKNGCPWDESACSWAAAGVHIDCLQYMRGNGLEWDRYDEYLDSTK